MPSTKVTVGVVVAVVLLLVSAMMIMTSRSKPPPVDVQPVPPAPRKKSKKKTAAPATTAPATTAPATTAPTTTPQVFVYPDPYSGLLPPPPPAILVPAMPTFIMVPGAHMPGMVGRRRDEVTTYIMTRYPRLVVRAIPAGSPISYDVRRDRVTVSYDPYTNRVVTARVG